MSQFLFCLPYRRSRLTAELPAKYFSDFSISYRRGVEDSQGFGLKATAAHCD
jgi:hypothetical protein